MSHGRTRTKPKPLGSQEAAGVSLRPFQERLGGVRAVFHRSMALEGCISGFYQGLWGVGGGCLGADGQFGGFVPPFWIEAFSEQGMDDCTCELAVEPGGWKGESEEFGL